jgi:hypothetical protein
VLPRMKLYCAISPLRIFLGSVSGLWSTSTKKPRSVKCSCTSDAYSYCSCDQQGCGGNNVRLLTKGCATGITTIWRGESQNGL